MNLLSPSLNLNKLMIFLSSTVLKRICITKSITISTEIKNISLTINLPFFLILRQMQAIFYIMAQTITLRPCPWNDSFLQHMARLFFSVAHLISSLTAPCCLPNPVSRNICLIKICVEPNQNMHQV